MRLWVAQYGGSVHESHKDTTDRPQTTAKRKEAVYQSLKGNGRVLLRNAKQ